MKNAIFPYRLYVMRDDHIITKGCGDVQCTDEQDTIARMLLAHLNDHLSHGGQWQVEFSDVQKSARDVVSYLYRINMPKKMVVAWFDEDGDQQFNVHFKGEGHCLLNFGLDNMQEVCETSWQEWYKRIYEMLDVRPYEQIRVNKNALH
jgi:hypothetical protein